MKIFRINFLFIIDLWNLFPKSRSLFIGNFFIALILPILDLFSLAVFFPFLSTLLNSNMDSNDSQIFQLLETIGISDLSVEIWLLSFIFLTLFSSLLRVISIYAQEKFILSYSAKLSQKIMYNLLHQTSNFLNRQPIGNWSSLVLVKTQDVMRSSVNSIILLTATLLFFSVTLSIFLLMKFWMVLLSLSPLVFVYLIIVLATKARSENFGQTINDTTAVVYKNLNETFALRTQVIVDKKQRYFIEKFKVALSTLNSTFVKVALLRDAPKLIIETVLIVFLCFITLILINLNYDTSSLIPFAATATLAAYRFLPFVNQIYRSVNSLLVSQEMLREVRAQTFLKPVIGSDENTKKRKRPIRAWNLIAIRKLDIEIGIKKKILFREAELQVRKGEIVYLSGETGSGKSTLLNLLSGSTYPDDNNLLIDGVKLDLISQSTWFDQVAYVQQQIYFENNTMIHNILFGDKIDKENLDKCKKLLRICDLLDVYEKNFGAVKAIGDNGIYLSGGQRQRLAICRALYKNPQLLLLDEATSGLDSKIEKRILENIINEYSDLTIVIVSHNKALSEFADKILTIENGMIKQSAK